MSVPDDCAAVSQSRVRANQTDDPNAHRFWFGAGRYKEDAEAIDRYGRLRKKGSNHTSFRNNFLERYRRRSEEVVEDRIRSRRIESMAKETFKPRMSDEAVESKTGKTWSRWFKHHDAAGGKKMTHQEIAAHLRDKHDVRPWWTQMVAVTYEQARGLREVHEKPSGYEISVSRTVDAPLSKAFKAWTDDKTRKKWL